MRKLNYSMLIQWILFIPIILPISLVIGAVEGVKQSIERAQNDILENQELV